MSGLIQRLFKRQNKAHRTGTKILLNMTESKLMQWKAAYEAQDKTSEDYEPYPEILKTKYSSLSVFLLHTLQWDITPQGYDFWLNECDTAKPEDYGFNPAKNAS